MTFTKHARPASRSWTPRGTPVSQPVGADDDVAGGPIGTGTGLMADPGNTTLILSDHTRITFLGLQKVVPADTRTLRTGISPSDAAALEEIDHIIERLDTEIPQVLAHDLDDATLSDEIDRIIARLDAEIPARKREMDELLSRLRTTLIRAA